MVEKFRNRVRGEDGGGTILQRLAAGEAGVDVMPVGDRRLAILPAQKDDSTVAFGREIEQATIEVFHQHAGSLDPFNGALDAAHETQEFAGGLTATVPKSLLQTGFELRPDLHDPIARGHQVFDIAEEFSQERVGFTFGEISVKWIHDEKRAGRKRNLLRISVERGGALAAALRTSMGRVGSLFGFERMAAATRRYRLRVLNLETAPHQVVDIVNGHAG